MMYYLFKVMSPTDQELKPLKRWVTINVFSLQFDYTRYLLSGQKTDWHMFPQICILKPKKETSSRMKNVYLDVFIFIKEIYVLGIVMILQRATWDESRMNYDWISYSWHLKCFNDHWSHLCLTLDLYTLLNKKLPIPCLYTGRWQGDYFFPRQFNAYLDTSEYLKPFFIC